MLSWWKMTPFRFAKIGRFFFNSRRNCWFGRNISLQLFLRWLKEAQTVLSVCNPTKRVGSSSLVASPLYPRVLRIQMLVSVCVERYNKRSTFHHLWQVCTRTAFFSWHNSKEIAVETSSSGFYSIRGRGIHVSSLETNPGLFKCRKALRYRFSNSWKFLPSKSSFYTPRQQAERFHCHWKAVVDCLG